MISDIKKQKQQFIVKCDDAPVSFFLFAKVYLNNTSKAFLETTPESLKLYYIPPHIDKIEDYLFKSQMRSSFLNSSVLYFLYKNPEYIPNYWLNHLSNDPKSIVFGGTIFWDGRHKYVQLLEIWKDKVCVGYCNLETSSLPFAIVI